MLPISKKASNKAVKVLQMELQVQCRYEMCDLKQKLNRLIALNLG